jgi:transcriptional regulator with XRE-family HTH domain
MMIDGDISLTEINIDEEIKIVNEIFRYNLKLLRASEELSGEELSNKLQLPLKRINDLEGGRMPPNLEDLIKIVNHYPITFDDLLDYKIGLLIKSSNQ